MDTGSGHAKLWTRVRDGRVIMVAIVTIGIGATIAASVAAAYGCDLNLTSDGLVLDCKSDR